MLELGIGADVLRGVGWMVRLLLVAAIAYALWSGKNWKRKLLNVGLVLLVFSAPLWPGIGEQIRYKRKYESAKELFDERCKTIGEKISRTVDNVDGVVWLKWRTAGSNREQFALDDPYGKDCSMEGCILRLLRGNEVRAVHQGRGMEPTLGYGFVETIDPRNGIRYRYTGVFMSIADVPEEQFSEHVRRTGYGAELDGRFLALQREPVDSFSAQFGIVWDDVSTREERESWIAGGMLKVIDLQTNEAIAQRIGYLIDTGQGSTAGGRDPWGWARSYAPRCPGHHETTWNFAMRVLQPTRKGEQR